MKTLRKIILAFLFTTNFLFAMEYNYILNDNCINNLFTEAQYYFQDTNIEIVKDARGLILRQVFEDSTIENNYIDINLFKKIEYFLAKIENFAIIEVHVEDIPNGKFSNLKKWEASTIIANDIEAIITKPFGEIDSRRIKSIGYGEFLPINNTPYNGSNKSNRVDIIILCNIIGE